MSAILHRPVRTHSRPPHFIKPSKETATALASPVMVPLHVRLTASSCEVPRSLRGAAPKTRLNHTLHPPAPCQSIQGRHGRRPLQRGVSRPLVRISCAMLRSLTFGAWKADRSRRLHSAL